ncbi:MFS transporter [Methylomonas lenta]|uniref:MFS transporter n=1 Tax=Methylomonas lenta TaxID=980561 RepID=A0A177N9F1_9GAMM|nr:lysophospholipid transporter LplT [Methylomonas lenta]OAI14512.1 MFS transporter [Methylomonas lenta]
MSKYIYPLLIAQFLSAFADNAILFTVIALVMQTAEPASWYIPALQSVFLIAFVVLAPWVGAFADNYAKSRVLIVANIIKAAGAGLLLINIEPLIAYCLVGVGAALYSPAKYGILPELAGHNGLVKANSWIEGSTILAILTGMVVGAKVADYSITWALLGTVVLYLISAATTLFLPTNISRKPAPGSKVVLFFQEVGSFLALPRSRFAVLGSSLFWATAACVRVIIIAWAPLVLMSHNASDIANLTLFLALGIIAGSALVPRLIPLEHLRRARIPAYLMALLIMCLSFTEAVWPARMVLFLMGTAGGMFIVPINAALQEIGQQSIGSGGAVAMQNFFQNVAMLLSVGTYTFAASQQVSPIAALLTLGGLMWLSTFLVVLRLPDISSATARK